jgi:exodeoxyribonuclease VIII
MIDLETLGTIPGCTILSIGAVEFSVEHGLGREFHVYIDRKSCKIHGLKEDQSTIEWWKAQSEEAKAIFDKVDSPDAKPLPIALSDLLRWIDYWNRNKVRVWGNGSDFDNAILAVAHAQIGVPLPWKFWNNRCFRTLKNLVQVDAVERVGIYHSALDDAKTQALDAINMLRKLP